MIRPVVTSAILLLPAVFARADDVPSGSSPIRLSLVGTHRFIVGDDPLWSRADFDDSEWRTMPVPGRWNHNGVDYSEWIGWYRIRFRGEQWMRKIQPAVLLGQISDADEAWLNGQRIGGYGTIGRRFSTATFVNRLYRLPPQSIRIGEDNVIAIRVMRVYYEGGLVNRIPDLEPGIGDYRDLRLAMDRHERTGDSIRSILILFYLVGACVGFALFKDRELRGPYAWLSSFMLLYAAVYVLSENSIIRAGLLTPEVELAVNAALAAGPWLAMQFTSRMLRQEFALRLKALTASASFVYLIVVFVSGPEQRKLMLTVSDLLILIPVLTVPVWSIRGVLQRAPGARVVTFGLTVLTISHLLQFVPDYHAILLFGIPLDAYGALVLIVCCLVVLLLRFRALRQQVETTSRALLVAQEDERRRLSRELHDGANQSIFAMRLALQMAHEQASAGIPVDAESLSELVQETEQVSDELRRIVAELRPSVLEQMSLADAIRWHGEEMSKRSDLEISVTSSGDASTSEQVKDHVFRIWQETLQNVIQHAEAGSVVVTVRFLGEQIEVSMHDDGRGFATEKESLLRGHGMHTIRERAELLGGSAEVVSRPDRGTTVIVRVPRHA